MSFRRNRKRGPREAYVSARPFHVRHTCLFVGTESGVHARPFHVRYTCLFVETKSGSIRSTHVSFVVGSGVAPGAAHAVASCVAQVVQYRRWTQHVSCRKCATRRETKRRRNVRAIRRNVCEITGNTGDTSTYVKGETNEPRGIAQQSLYFYS